jgi:hypothetical protein
VGFCVSHEGLAAEKGQVTSHVALSLR